MVIWLDVLASGGREYMLYRRMHRKSYSLINQENAQ